MKTHSSSDDLKTPTFKRHGVLVTMPDERGEPEMPGVSEAEREHLLARIRRRRRGFFCRLEYNGYPGGVQIIPDKHNLWRFQLGYGFHYAVEKRLPSPSAYRTVDAALDAAIKMFIEGRKLSRGKPQRGVSAMEIAQEQQEKRKRQK